MWSWNRLETFLTYFYLKCRNNGPAPEKVCKPVLFYKYNSLLFENRTIWIRELHLFAILMNPVSVVLDSDGYSVQVHYLTKSISKLKLFSFLFDSESCWGVLLSSLPGETSQCTVHHLAPGYGTLQVWAFWKTYPDRKFDILSYMWQINTKLGRSEYR